MSACWNCGKEVSTAYCLHCGKSQKNAPASPTSSSVVRAPSVEVMPPAGNPRALNNAVAPSHVLNSHMQDIGTAVVTPRAAHIMGRSDEGMVWADKPSPVLLLGRVFTHIIIFCVIMFFTLPSLQWGGLWLVVAFLDLGWRFFQLYSTKYLLSSQRLEITTGGLSQRTVTLEIHQLGNAEIVAPLYLRIFGLSNLVVAHRGSGFPAVILKGIRNAKGVRDVIRGGGQIEASRFDKVAWR